jgi:hypothetical protein
MAASIAVNQLAQGWHAWFRLLHTWFLLLTCLDEPGVADVATIPTRERLVVDDLGVHHHLDVHIEEGHDLKVLEFIVANLA